MRKKRLLTLIGSICLVLVLAALPFMGACAPSPPTPLPPPPPPPTPPPPPPTPEQVFDWKVPYYGPETAILGVFHKNMAREMEERTNGRLQMTVYYSGELCSLPEHLPAVTSGLVDWAIIMTAWYPAALPLWNVHNLPLVGPKTVDQTSWAIIEYAKLPDVRAELDRQNVVFVGSAGSTPANFIGNEQVLGLEDLKGLRVGIFIEIGELLTEVGAVPVKVTFSDLYTHLDTGVVDVVTGGPPIWQSLHLEEVSKYITMGLDLGQSPAPWFANKDSWNALPDDIKAIFINEGFPIMSAMGYDLFGDPVDQKEYLDKCRARGIEIVQFPPEDRAKLVEAAAKSWEAWIERSGGDKARQALDAWLALVKEVEAKYPGGRIYEPYDWGKWD